MYTRETGFAFATVQAQARILSNERQCVVRQVECFDDVILISFLCLISNNQAELKAVNKNVARTAVNCSRMFENVYLNNIPAPAGGEAPCDAECFNSKI